MAFVPIRARSLGLDESADLKAASPAELAARATKPLAHLAEQDKRIDESRVGLRLSSYSGALCCCLRL